MLYGACTMSMFTVWLCCIQIWCASAVTAVSVPGVHVTHIDTERKLLQSEDDDYMAMKGMEVINHRDRKNKRNYALKHRKKQLLRGSAETDASDKDDDRFNFIRPEHLVDKLRRGEAGTSVEPRHRHRFELWRVPDDPGD